MKTTCLLALLVGLLAPTAALAQESLLAVRATQLIDGVGEEPIRPAMVLIRGERIEAVGTDLEIPDGTLVMDLGSATLLPGLIDLHTHLTDRVGLHWEDVLLKSTPGQAALFGAKNARDTLMAGFTTCRDMGPTWPYVDVDLRYAIEEGAVVGPRLQVAGNYISSTGGAGDARQFSIYVDVPTVRNLADGVDSVRRAARTNLKNGADFLKILVTGAVLSKGIPPGAQQYTDEEIEAAVEEASRWGRFVAAHAHGAEGIKTAIRLGVRTIDHGSMLDAEGVRMLQSQSFTYYVPTLYVGTEIRERGKELGIPPEEIERDRVLSEHEREAFRRALQAGLPIAFGTDAGVFEHGRNAREFVVRVGLGESPMQSIRSATSLAAEVMGWSDRVGSIQPGRYADLIAVEGDPLQDITQLQRVKWVMKGGRVYRDALTK